MHPIGCYLHLLPVSKQMRWAVEQARPLSDVRGALAGTPARAGPCRSVTAEPSLLRVDLDTARIRSPHSAPSACP